MQEDNKKAVLILAAGSIKNKYQSFTFLFNSPGLLPIASRSVLSIILDFYLSSRYCCYVCVNEEDLSVLQNEMVYYKNVRFIALAQSAGVVDSLAQSLKSVQEADVTVNLVTSVPSQLAPPDTAFLSRDAESVDYYSGIEMNGSEDAPTFTYQFKGSKAANSFFPFTGIFRANKSTLELAASQTTRQTDLLEVIKRLQEKTAVRVEKTEWIDVGHEINYADARRKMISSRSFNSIQVSSHSGILTKKSEHKQKLGNETKYVTMLPTELQVFYPRIFSFSGAEGTVDMEYYGYPNLSEYQLYRDIQDVQWVRIFQSLEHVLELMRQFPFSIGKEAFVDFYFNKTLQRITDFEKQLPDSDLFADSITINGKKCEGFRRLSDTVRQRIDAMYTESNFGIMHGDFCFNNILFDTFSGTAKLIDPRGSFGEKCVGIYGDVNYDLAKLLHSTVGHYDYIVNNLFRLDGNAGEGYSYSFPLRKNAGVLNDRSEKLLQNLGADRRTICFIVGLLFLSMCPLHSDNRNRQKLMYLHGLYFINQNL